MSLHLTARLTPAFSLSCGGYVHSVFDRAVNLAFSLPSGERLLSLMDPALPAGPGSICAPAEVRKRMRVRMRARLSPEALETEDAHWLLEPDALYTGKPAVYGTFPEAERFLDRTRSLSSGFDLLPASRRSQALEALCTPRTCRFLGLGCGLTPSYDDACVGAAAVYRALGRPAPFAFEGLERTTDVSARYLKLAEEGYFSRPLLDVTAALAGQKDMDEALDAIRLVGATSGADMLTGVRQALAALGFKGKRGEAHGDL